ncbi:hypothetical protein [Marinobacter sp. SS21]|uniref:hypothetical protein n=1 Tax=Marinobacter sp. SS21 TaxID=2979460 RepID=UPI00232CDF32|nr:hypothetical protein [Marinobacter sp. SS21]MDC0661501.1 hypothetical protein [Marinobacter sp. SS21]
MSLPSAGAQHYVLLLIPALLRELERMGVEAVIAKSGLPENEITRLFFQARSLGRNLPVHPASLGPDLWPELLQWARVLTSLVNLISQDDLLHARNQAVSQYLPQARQHLLDELARQREEGEVDFHLAGMVRGEQSANHADEICMEALRLEREQRYDSINQLIHSGLSELQSSVVREAQDYAREGMLRPPDDFSTLDLVIRLLDLLKAEIAEACGQGRNPGDDSTIASVVLGLGNLLYREELGLMAHRAGDVNLL